MPYCQLSSCEEEENKGVKLFYRRYGHGKTKVLLIIGFGATLESWAPQVKGLTGTIEPRDDDDEAQSSSRAGQDEEEEGIEVCCFDNRGIGRSSVPTDKHHYSTTIMARDALSLMDHLGWKKAHVFGHSMGGMIACKLASIAPERLCSLALLNVTGGGYQCFPRIDLQLMSLAFRFIKADTPEERATVDLEVHYTKEYLDETIGSTTRRKILFQEYVKGMASGGMQPKHGHEGQVHACWNHNLTQKEIDTLRLSGFPIAIIHGREDLLAQICHGRNLAERLHPAARMVELHGAHLVSHERPDEEINSSNEHRFQVSTVYQIQNIENSQLSLGQFQNMETSIITNLEKSGIKTIGEHVASGFNKGFESKFTLQQWSDLTKIESDRSLALSNRNNNRAVVLVTLDSLMAKMQLSFFFFVGSFFMFCGHMLDVVKIVKPVRVLAVES